MNNDFQLTISNSYFIINVVRAFLFHGIVVASQPIAIGSCTVKALGNKQTHRPK